MLPIIVVLCILLISLFHPQILEPYTKDDDRIVVDIEKDPYLIGTEEYRKSGHRAGGAEFYMKGENPIPHHDKILAHRGFEKGYMDRPFVSDVLAGDDGHIPTVDVSDLSGKTEGFWYDINTIEDGPGTAGMLDAELKYLVNEEKRYVDNTVLGNIKKKAWNPEYESGYAGLGGKAATTIRGDVRMVGHTPASGVAGLNSSEQRNVDRLSEWDSSTPAMVEKFSNKGFWQQAKRTEHGVLEGFGTNRSAHNWNEKDYPIVTSNGLNMTASFPQDGKMSGVHQDTSVLSMWGDLDTLAPDPVFAEMAGNSSSGVVNSVSRIATSHIAKS
jgi:hypothetical protein